MEKEGDRGRKVGRQFSFNCMPVAMARLLSSDSDELKDEIIIITLLYEKCV